MMVSDIQLFQILKQRLGEKEANETNLKTLATKEDLIKEIAPIKAELLVVKWMLGFVLTGILALIVKTFF